MAKKKEVPVEEQEVKVEEVKEETKQCGTVTL